MKTTKLYIYATDYRQYLKGNLEWALAVSTDGGKEGGGWTLVGESDVELTIDLEGMKKSVLDRIEETRLGLLAKLEILQREKDELLSIEYTPK